MIFALHDMQDLQQHFASTPVNVLTGNALIDATITSILNRIELMDDGYQIREDLSTALPGLQWLASQDLDFAETWERLEYFLQETIFHDRYNIELASGDLVSDIHDIIIIKKDNDFYPTQPLNNPTPEVPCSVAA